MLITNSDPDIFERRLDRAVEDGWSIITNLEVVYNHNHNHRVTYSILLRKFDTPSPDINHLLKE